MSLSCPPQDCTKCASNEVCVLGVASQDNPCPSITCSAAMANTNTDSGKSSSGTSAGAIAGGVVGGVAAAAIFGFFVWFFCFSKRAQRVREEKEWIPVVGQDHVTDNHTAGQMPPNHRNSSSTFASLASSALSRASNVIPIAYVPGVTSRGQMSRDSSTGGTLGSNPPIPNVPWEYQFTPEELLRQSRQSTVYGIRDSVNTEAYRESQAYVSSAMMTAIQAKPMLVNVKDGHVTNNDGSARDSALRQSFMSGTSDGSVYEIASAERVNARSIRIGKAQRVGLQSTYISEESEEEIGGGASRTRDSTHSAAVPIGLDRPTLGRSLTGNSGSGVSGVSRKSEVPPLPAALEVSSSEAPQLDEDIFAGLDIPVQLITTDDGQESPFDDKFRL
ncbi:hypothetical protein LXG23DRAFT_46151 [Yarrowia lipolytica]|nr:hypothetical protein LXG23DRAFT_46151 [Yarrowia lipolytica]